MLGPRQRSDTARRVGGRAGPAATTAGGLQAQAVRVTLRGSCHPSPCGRLDSGSPLALASSLLRGSVDEQQAPMVPFCCVPYPSPPRPWVRPLPAFPGRSDVELATTTYVALETVAGEDGCGGHWNPRPKREASLHSNLCFNHSKGSARPRPRQKREAEAGACSRAARTQTAARGLLRLLAFPPVGKRGLALRPQERSPRPFLVLCSCPKVEVSSEVPRAPPPQPRGWGLQELAGGRLVPRLPATRLPCDGHKPGCGWRQQPVAADTQSHRGRRVTNWFQAAAARPAGLL